VQPNPPEDVFHKPNVYPVLIKPELWQRVQERFASNRRQTSPRKYHVYLFPGLLTCAHCGAPLHGAYLRGRKGTIEYFYYVCGTHRVSGNPADAGPGCHRYWIKENDLLDTILNAIHTLFEDEGVLQKIEKRLANLPDSARFVKRRQALSQQIAKTEKSIQEGARQLLQHPDLAPHITAAIREAEEKLRTLRAQQEQEQNHAQELEKAQQAVATIQERLQTLRQTLPDADPLLLRDLFTKLFQQLKLSFHREPKKPSGKQFTCHLSHVIMVLQTQLNYKDLASKYLAEVATDLLIKVEQHGLP
jgi:hypothetical protein